MARSVLVLMVVAALLLNCAMAQSPASSPVATPHKKTKHHSHAVSPSPAASPAAGVSPLSPNGAAPTSPSSISTPPTGAPGPAQNAAVYNRFTVAASAAVVVFSAALLM